MHRFESDSKIAAIALLLSYGLTAIFALIVSENQQDRFWLSFYSSWTEDIIFFSIVGLIFTALSLRRPELEHFQTRVQILFSGNKGPAVDYISDKIRQMGYYAVKVRRELVIEKYDDDYGAYLIRFKSTNYLKNLFDDIDAKVLTGFGITPDKPGDFKQAPSPVGLITSMKIEGEPEKVSAAIIVPPGGCEHPMEIAIPPGEERRLIYEYELWCAVGAVQDHVPRRFTVTIEEQIVNKWVDEAKVPCIEIIEPDVNNRTTCLGFNQAEKLGPRLGVSDGEHVLAFRLLEPEES